MRLKNSRPQWPPAQEPLVIEALELAAAAAHLADLKKAEDIAVLELDGSNRIADYVVVATGRSRPQIKALYNELHTRLKAAGETHSRAEGVELGWWVLLDFGDVIVHLMQGEAREYYDMEGLYREARPVDWRAVKLPELPLPRRRLRGTGSDVRDASPQELDSDA